MSTDTLTQPPSALDGTWVGAGHSADVDARAAGRRAAAAAVAGREPSLMLVFCAADGPPTEVCEGVRELAGPDTVVAGMSVAGVIGQQGAADGGVAVLALGPGYEVRAVLAREPGTDHRMAGETAAGAAAGLGSPHRLAMLLCEGLSGQQHTVVRGAYAVLGAGVPMVGACAADELAWERTFQFLGGADGVEVVDGAVLGLGIGASRRFHGIGVQHGWHRTGEPMVVTSSSDGVVQQLDGRPALDVYLERAGIDRGLLEDDDAFRAAALLRPLGLSRRSTETLRVVYAADRAAGSIACLADVPQGALAWMMDAEPADVVGAGLLACTSAVAELDGEAGALLLFDCGARKVLLGPDGVAAESAALDGTGGTPVVGMFTFGQIARQSGSRGMHNLTCAALALG